MNEITGNEIAFVLTILKSPETDYNANSIAKHLQISSMGALKIAKRLEKEGIIASKELGKAKFLKLKLDKEYVKDYLKFLLKREAEQAPAYIRRWINEVRKTKKADAAILFGSVINKQEKANDIDVLFITDAGSFSNLKKEIEEINLVNSKHLHPVYQTENDFKDNIGKNDKPLLNAVKGIVAYGEDKFIELLK